MNCGACESVLRLSKQVKNSTSHIAYISKLSAIFLCNFDVTFQIQ